ncbi:HDOD domain-containing protein [bacterium]|nr:HDOD domain-containing protein [bacterium]
MGGNPESREDSSQPGAVGGRIVPLDGTSAEHLERMIRDMADVPVFPAAGLKLLAAFRNPYYNARQLGEIISGDVGMSARVLRMANSAYYSIKNKVTTVNHAVTLLGVREMEQMAMNLCFMSVSPQESGGGDRFDPLGYTRHSMMVGKVAEYLSGVIVFQMLGRGEAYAAGLLHDVGMILLYRNRRAALSEALTVAREKGLGYAQAELAVLQVSHAALGAWLAQMWNLPRNLCEAIAYHHSMPPETAIQPELVALLKLSEALAQRLEAATLAEILDDEPLDAPTLRILGARGLPADPRELVDVVYSRHEEDFARLGREVEGMLSAASDTAPRRTVGDLQGRIEPERPPPTPDKDGGGLSRLKRWFGRQ